MHLSPQQDKIAPILEATQQGWWEWDLENNTTYHSPYWYQMLGYDPADYQSSFENWISLMHPDDRRKSLEKQAYYIQTEKAWELEFRMQEKSGDYIWIRSRAAVLERNEEGEPLKVGGVHQNINYQKQLEMELAQAREEKELLNGIIRVSPASFKIYDFLEKRFTYSSKVPEVDTENNQIHELVHTEDYEKVQAHIQQLLKAKDNKIFTCVFRMITPENQVNWMLLRDMVYKRTRSGQVLQVIGSMLDISQFMRTKEKLRKNVEKIKEISHINAHNLRGPVSTIIAISDLMIKDDHLGDISLEESKEMLRMMNFTVRKLDEVVHQINQRVKN